MYVAVLAAALLVVACLVYRRSRELFRIAVEGGRLRVVRGRPPAAMLNRFGDILARTPRGEVRAYRASGGARLAIRGTIEDGTAQQLRNVFGLYPISQLAAPGLDASSTASSLRRERR